MNASDILKALLQKHSLPEWASFPELRDGTGMLAKRAIDLYTISCWGASKGVRAVAYEIKTSRADYLRELDDPSKRAAAETYAHECWIAAPKGLLKADEVLHGWGLLEVTPAKTFRTKIAAQRSNVEIDIYFVASLARRIVEAAGNSHKALCLFGGEEVTSETLSRVIDEHGKKAAAAYKSALKWQVERELRESAEFTALHRLRSELQTNLRGVPLHEAIEHLVGKARNRGFVERKTKEFSEAITKLSLLESNMREVAGMLSGLSGEGDS